MPPQFTFLLLDVRERTPHLVKHLVRSGHGVDRLDQILRPVVIHDGHRVVDVRVEALLQTLRVVVRAAAAFAALQTPGDALLLGALEEQHEQQAHLVAHLAVPALQVVLVAREPVDQELVVAGGLRKREGL